MIKIDKIYINGIKKESIAEELGLEIGDYLVNINGQKIVDILDYKFLIADSYIEVEILHKNGESEIYEIEKDESLDLGIEFETELIDKPHNCYNNCIFCFMEQLPKNVRETLIFKDDDYRLSFFTGNYITLTNMKLSDIDRIIAYRLSPINISIHATDEIVRCKMLNNKNAGKVLSYLPLLYNANISMNTQIVLCKGINDGDILDKTITDLSKFAPVLKSICIVPVGLSKERENLHLYPLLPILKEDSKVVIQKISKYQEEFLKRYKTRLVYLADEFYLKAGVDFPKYSEYEDFVQLENGVGMISLFDFELNKYINSKKIKNKINVSKRTITVITGKITEEYINKKSRILENIIPNLTINVIAPVNNYFGENITVTGLVTGGDIIDTINKKNIDLGDFIVIPKVMLKEDEDIFLDDITLEYLQKKLNKKIVISDGSAIGFVDSLLVNSDKKIYKMKSKIKYNSYENNEKF